MHGRSIGVDFVGKWDEWIGGDNVIACDVPTGRVFEVVKGATARAWTDSVRSVGGH